jgi:hypothetical protein
MNMLTTGAPAVIAASRHPVEQGWTPPPVGHHRRPGGCLPYADACLSLLLCCDPGLYFFDWCRAPSPSHVVAVELQGQLLARERELDSREGVITAWEDGLAAFERALGEVMKECCTGHIRAEAVQQDFFAQAHVSYSRSK